MNNIAKLVLLIAVNACFMFDAIADDSTGIEDSQLGLNKEPLKNISSPTGFKYNDKFPGSSELLPRSYPGAPPQIPHNIESFIPVTKDNNMCKGCHDTPDNIGKPRVKGTPTPIPASHYTDLRFGTPQDKQLVGARTVCTQCHVPQAQVEPLVENTFSANMLASPAASDTTAMKSASAIETNTMPGEDSNAIASSDTATSQDSAKTGDSDDKASGAMDPWLLLAILSSYMLMMIRRTMTITVASRGSK